MLRNLTIGQFLCFHEHWRTNLNADLNIYCDGVVLEIYLDYKFNWPQGGLNYDSLAYEVIN